jgi:hypothetical protein
MKYTTLNEIVASEPCDGPVGLLLQSLGKTECDDEPLSFKTALEIVGMPSCWWLTRLVSVEENRAFREEVIEKTQHLDKRLPVIEEIFIKHFCQED